MVVSPAKFRANCPASGVMRPEQRTHREIPALPQLRSIMSRAETVAAPSEQLASPPLDAHHSAFYPSCGARLQESRCKLVCRARGSFVNRADFD
jgi:hypothetical protein